MAPKNKPAFKEGDKLLCYQGPLAYEARCLKVSVKGNGQVKFRVHYTGWSKSRDEWVEESRTLKWTPDNAAKHKALAEAENTPKRNKGHGTPRPATSKPTTPGSGSGGKSPLAKDFNKQGPMREMRPRKKAKHSAGVETEDEFRSRIEVRIPLPDDLRRRLVSDWDMITNEKKLMTLPREPSVAQILQSYKAARENNPSFTEEVLGDVIQGLQTYFDQALGTLLLYRFERLQHNNMLDTHKSKAMSELYGGEHLLRLLVKLPMLLAQTAMDEESLATLATHLQDFMKFLVKNSSVHFSGRYEFAPKEYVRMADHQ